MLRRLAASAALCLVAFQARASVVWRGDFESNDLSQWSKVDGLASRLTVETVPGVVREVLAERNGSLTGEAMIEAVREAILSANSEVWKRARVSR